MNELDFSRQTVLVVGGASGIGNGIAHAFRKRAADVHVWGTRENAPAYAGEEGCDLSGLHYARMDVCDFAAVEHCTPPFDALHVLVLCQGTVLYRREEFAMPGFAKVLDVNLHSVMACATRFRDMLAATRGALITVSSVSGYGANVGNPAYAASKAGVVSLTKTLAQAWAGRGIRVNGIAPGYRRYQAHQGDDEKPRTAAARARRHSDAKTGQPAGHGRRGAVPGVTAGGLCVRPDLTGGRRVGALIGCERDADFCHPVRC